MIEKLEMIHQRFIEVSDLIIEPEIMSDMKRYVAINKEYKDLQKIEKAYQEYKTVLANIAESKDILANETDPEMKEMAKMELDEALPRKEEMDEEIKWLLIPKDPEDAKNAQFEIRAGTGGDEASIFAGDLFRLYTKYCEGRGWKVD
ncbi:MAG: PCRF domain-containing protein, partial [Flavobacteriales bacterium]